MTHPEAEAGPPPDAQPPTSVPQKQTQAAVTLFACIATRDGQPGGSPNTENGSREDVRAGLGTDDKSPKKRTPSFPLDPSRRVGTEVSVSQITLCPQGLAQDKDRSLRSRGKSRTLTPMTDPKIFSRRTLSRCREQTQNSGGFLRHHLDGQGEKTQKKRAKKQG